MRPDVRVIVPKALHPESDSNVMVFSLLDCLATHAVLTEEVFNHSAVKMFLNKRKKKNHYNPQSVCETIL